MLNSTPVYFTKILVDQKRQRSCFKLRSPGICARQPFASKKVIFFLKRIILFQFQSLICIKKKSIKNKTNKFKSCVSQENNLCFFTNGFQCQNNVSIDGLHSWYNGKLNGNDHITKCWCDFLAMKKAIFNNSQKENLGRRSPHFGIYYFLSYLYDFSRIINFKLFISLTTFIRFHAICQ